MLKIAFDPIYKHQLKIGHRFPMEKYELLPEHLLRNNICNSDNFFSPLPIEKQLLLSTQVLMVNQCLLRNLRCYFYNKIYSLKIMSIK